MNKLKIFELLNNLKTGRICLLQNDYLVKELERFNAPKSLFGLPIHEVNDILPNKGSIEFGKPVYTYTVKTEINKPMSEN